MDKTVLFQDMCSKINRNTIVSPSDDVPVPSAPKSRDSFLILCYKLATSLQTLQQYLTRESPKYLHFDDFSNQFRMTTEQRDQMDKYLRDSLSDIERNRQLLKKLFSKQPKTTLQNEEHKWHLEAVINYIDFTSKRLDGTVLHLRRSRKKNEKQIKECSYLLKAKKMNAHLGEIPVYQSISMDIPLAEETVQELSLENKLLQERLFKFDTQIENIYKQVTEIQSLTEQFAHQAVLEEEKLTNLQTSAEDSFTHLREGIKNLQDLKTNSKDLRLFVVTLLLFYSFSLMFLHWINT